MFYQPGLSINVSFKSSAITKSPWNQKTIVMNLTFDLCQTGEIFDTNQCKKCSPGFYSLENDPFYNGSCQVCDQNAICFGGNLIVPKKGYWRMNSTANLIITCPQDDVCLGSSFIKEYMTISGNCSNGYEGNLCGICSNGYNRISTSFECFDCSSNWSDYILVIMAFFIKLVIYVYLVKLTFEYIKDARDNNGNLIIESKITFMKILINYWELAAIMKIFQIRWPIQIHRLLGITLSILITFADVLFIECYLGNFDDKSFVKFAFKMVIVIVLSTACVVILMVLILLPYNKLKKISNRPCLQNILNYLHLKKEKIFTILMIFLIYINKS